jgi:hypothetical protein
VTDRGRGASPGSGWAQPGNSKSEGRSWRTGLCHSLLAPLPTSGKPTTSAQRLINSSAPWPSYGQHVGGAAVADHVGGEGILSPALHWRAAWSWLS